MHNHLPIYIGICVIDLDTVMPGYIISDIGKKCTSMTKELVTFRKVFMKIYFALFTKYPTR